MYSIFVELCLVYNPTNKMKLITLNHPSELTQMGQFQFQYFLNVSQKFFEFGIKDELLKSPSPYQSGFGDISIIHTVTVITKKDQRCEKLRAPLLFPWELRGSGTARCC